MVLCGGCGASVEKNNTLSGEVRTFVERETSERPFKELTEWDWDKVYVFDLADNTSERIDAVVGEGVAPGWATAGGLFVYFKDEKRVRVEILEYGGFCSGIYTTSAVVTSKYACWLHDEKFEKVPT